MAGDTTIRAIIKLLVEGGHIPKEVAKGLQDVGAKSRKTQEDLTGMGRAAKEVSGLLRQYLGAAAVGAIVKSSVGEFADLTRHFNALGFQMKKVGIDASEALPRARAELEALALSGGPLLSKTVPAMQKFITMTRDTDKALAAVKLASDVSESGVTDFGSAAAGVASLLQGRVKVAATQFGLDLTDINGKAKTNAALIAEISKTYGGLGDAFDDAANDLDSINARWEQAKQIIGKGLAPTLRIIPDVLFHAIGAFKDLGEVAGFVANTIVAEFRSAGRLLGAVFNFKTLFTDPGQYAANLKEAFSASFGDMKDSWKTFTDGVAANHTKATETVADNTKGLADLISQASKATAEDEAKAAAEAAQKKLDIEHKNTQDILQAQIAAAKEGSDERLALELALIDDQEKAAIEAAKRVGYSVAAITEGFALQRAAKEKEYREAREDADYTAESDRLRAEADLFAEGSQERLDAELAMLEREKAHQLRTFGGTIEGKRAIEAAYQATRIALIDGYNRELAQRELDAYRAQVEAQAELDSATRDEQLQAASEGEASLYQTRVDRLQAEYQFQLEMLALQEEADILSAEKRGESITGIEDAGFKKRLAAEKRFLLAKKQLDKEEVQTRREAGMAIADASIGFARAAFGETKAVRIAEVIVNTAAAVMQVWSKWAAYPPVAAALSALAIGTGIVQIGKIRSAKPEGKGFDDPVNDRRAYEGGRKWADDFVTHTEAGFSDRLDSARAEGRGPIATTKAAMAAPFLGGAKFSDAAAAQIGGTFGRIVKTAIAPPDLTPVVDAIKEAMATPAAAPSAPGPVDQSFHVHGNVYGGDSGMRELKRELDRAGRRDSNRVIT